MKKRYLIILLDLFILIGTGAFAQKKTQDSKADSAANKIASKLSVSKAKASQIQAAYNYNQGKIIALMKDTVMKPGQHMKLLKKLTHERQVQIDALLTPAQKDTLRHSQDAVLKRFEKRRKAFEQQHDAELNKVPHKSKNGINQTDSIKVNPNPKPRTKI